MSDEIPDFFKVLEEETKKVTRPNQSTKEKRFLKFDDIAQQLFSTVKQILVPACHDRVRRFLPLIIILLVVGNITILFTGSQAYHQASSKSVEIEKNLNQVKGVPESSFKSISTELRANLDSSQEGFLLLFLSMVLISGAATFFSYRMYCSSLSVLNTNLSDGIISRVVSKASLHFMMWKLRSPANAKAMTIFKDYDQIESNDIDFKNLKALLENSHLGLLNQPNIVIFLYCLLAGPVVFVPIFGIGLAIVLVAAIVSAVLFEQSKQIVLQDCLAYIPEPLESPYSEEEFEDQAMGVV